MKTKGKTLLQLLDLVPITKLYKMPFKIIGDDYPVLTKQERKKVYPREVDLDSCECGISFSKHAKGEADVYWFYLDDLIALE